MGDLTFGQKGSSINWRHTRRTLTVQRIEEQRRAQEHIVNYALMVEMQKVQEPGSLEEAMEDPKWYVAMQIEYDSITHN